MLAVGFVPDDTAPLPKVRGCFGSGPASSARSTDDVGRRQAACRGRSQNAIAAQCAETRHGAFVIEVGTGSGRLIA